MLLMVLAAAGWSGKVFFGTTVISFMPMSPSIQMSHTRSIYHTSTCLPMYRSLRCGVRLRVSVSMLGLQMKCQSTLGIGFRLGT